ncbi:MAG: CVNH domain-containing protein, partial [Francisellaceae bacterium]
MKRLISIIVLLSLSSLSFASGYPVTMFTIQNKSYIRDYRSMWPAIEIKYDYSWTGNGIDEYDIDNDEDMGKVIYPDDGSGRDYDDKYIYIVSEDSVKNTDEYETLYINFYRISSGINLGKFATAALSLHASDDDISLTNIRIIDIDRSLPYRLEIDKKSSQMFELNVINLSPPTNIFDSWDPSCGFISLTGTEISAVCLNKQNSSQTSTLDVRRCQNAQFKNDNGKLTCVNPGNWKPVEEAVLGSWSNHCRNASLNDSTLHAYCSDTNGTIISTELDLKSCPINNVKNDNGQLMCDLPFVSLTDEQNCKDIKYNLGILGASCLADSGDYAPRSTITPATCHNGEIANRNGKLVCAETKTKTEQFRFDIINNSLLYGTIGGKSIHYQIGWDSADTDFSVSGNESESLKLGPKGSRFTDDYDDKNILVTSYNNDQRLFYINIFADGGNNALMARAEITLNTDNKPGQIKLTEQSGQYGLVAEKTGDNQGCLIKIQRNKYTDWML